MFFIVREPVVQMLSNGNKPARRPSFGELFQHRNVALAMLTLMCAMGGIFVLAAMMPDYLLGFLQLSTPSVPA